MPKIENNIHNGFYISKDELYQLLKSVNYKRRKLDFITVSSQKKIDFVRIDEILYAQSEGNYTTFFLLNGTMVVSTKNIGEYENVLCDEAFFRIHTRYFVNLNRVLSVSKESGMYVIMVNGKKLPVAFRRAKRFNEIIKNYS